MLHTKFQGHRFWRRFSQIYTIYGHSGHAGMLPGPFEQIFVPLAPGGSIRNLVTVGPVAFGMMLETVEI